jgi:hypothetical protein
MSEPGRSAKSQEQPALHRVVLDDLRSGLHRSFLRDIRDLYLFYVDEDKRKDLAAMGKVRRFFVLVGWLSRSLLMKLLPSRRIMLLGAIFLGVLDSVKWSYGGTRVEIEVGFWAFLLLLVVLMLELKDKLLARDEIEVARGVQLALLPRGAPDFPGWRLAGLTLPANDVGGDLVDYLALDGRLGAALGDVAGKGLGAALLMAKLQATLRALAPGCSRLDELGRQLNLILNRDGLDNRYATLFYLEITSDSGVVRYMNAGHNRPYVVRRAHVETVPSSSFPLGMLPEADYAEDRVELAPGDLLFVYSDGLTEARDVADEEFGVTRLEALLPLLRGLTPERASERVLAEFHRFVGNARRHDDLSLLILERTV